MPSAVSLRKMPTNLQQAYVAMCSLVAKYFGIEVASEPVSLQELHARYRFNDTTDEIVATISLRANCKSIHHPGIYRFGKAEMTLTKRVNLTTRSNQGDNKLFDFLLALKQAWTMDNIEIRLTVGQDCDRATVINMEAVDADNNAVRFHMTS